MGERCVNVKYSFDIFVKRTARTAAEKYAFCCLLLIPYAEMVAAKPVINIFLALHVLPPI